MKKWSVLVLILYWSVFAAGQAPKPDPAKLGWLEGTWMLTNPRAGCTGVERWIKAQDGGWKGLGATLRGTDTVFVERLKLVKRDNNLYYVADLKENAQPVYFRFTKIDAKSFTCENAGHDFPKKIVYAFDGNFLRATVSGDVKSIEYLFRKTTP